MNIVINVSVFGTAIYATGGFILGRDLTSVWPALVASLMAVLGASTSKHTRESNPIHVTSASNHSITKLTVKLT